MLYDILLLSNERDNKNDMNNLQYDDYDYDYDDYDSFENDTLKYIKRKKSSTSKSSAKSKHKHEYVDCLFIERGRNTPYLGSYCKICGKIGETGLPTSEKMPNGFYRMLTAEEIFEEYSDLELIKIDSIWQKYIPINIEER